MKESDSEVRVCYLAYKPYPVDADFLCYLSQSLFGVAQIFQNFFGAK
jgi:hypothetical protein